MTSSPACSDKDYWLDNAWTLYNDIETGKDAKVSPNATTYALMLIAWHRYGSPYSYSLVQSPSFLLSTLRGRDIPVQYVVSDRTFSDPTEAASIIKTLSKVAVELNLPRVVTELGQAESIATHSPDILDSIPAARPVLKKESRNSESDTAEPDPDADPIQYEIPFNLDNLRRHLAEVCYARRVLPEDVAARQKLLEESVYDVAVQRLKRESEVFEELGIGGTMRQANLQRLMWDWHSKLQIRLTKEIENISKAEKTTHVASAHIAPYLALVKAERLSLITILEIMRMQGSGGVAEGMKTTRALVQLGAAVELEYKAQMCRKNNIYVPSTHGRPPNAGFFSNMGYNHLMERRVAAAKYMSDGEGWTSTWSQVARAKVGGILVECLMDVARVIRVGTDKETNEIVTEDQPAFYHSYEHQRGQKLGVIKLNPELSAQIAKDGVRETLHPRHLPMLVKPKPWLKHDDGGYYYNKTSAMRYKDSVEQQSYLKHASELGNVELVYAGLDVLGNTPWRINDRIFHVVLEVWNSGQRLGKLPPVAWDQPEPVKPADFDSDLRVRSAYNQQLKAWHQNKANNHSDRCSVNYKIEIARAFLGDVIYQPHNIDFRGRAYPIPPHLNHLGDDLSRGLLKFAEGKPLGERGLRWLKIHLANLYGYDKASFDDREAWVMERMEHIYDSATKPLEGNRWWRDADDPWQCLACCMELHDALESPNPLEFVSTIPVHQDGTCNGLQHYAALGGDTIGAAQVNLSPGSRPSDVYSYVGSMVEKTLAEDAANGDRLALLLKGKISRKVVKQTVMTTVYGVTYVGARDQIEKQLKLIDSISAEETWAASAYLAKVVLASIGNLFSGAKGIQTWLTLCAQLISKSIPEERLPEAIANPTSSKTPGDLLKKEQMTAVVWTTPLGLPIVQPYRKVRRKQVMTSLQTVYIEDPNIPAGVNGVKQASAFPPNFIHSLDATHMMLTALECQSQQLTFAAVHDSYWTHACSIDQMSTIIRDTFIALHSSDVLVRLDAEFRERYKGYKVPLTYLRNGALAKHLRDAGSKIVATPKQAENLVGVSNLVTVSETEDPTLREEEMDDEAEALMAAEAKNLMLSLKQVAQEEEDPYVKAAKRRALHTAKVNALLEGKFVDLTDILPPLPQKGTFNVEEIKRSPYFFS
ncbi:hypothetical protein C8J56DRAFT_790113 [Mycena floridula]|nr:hypothetical protein C8J56DRAFT_790113 [Mycena floridula]